MVRLFDVLPALLFATFARAALQITSPSSSIWWVAKSTNVMAWNCNDPSVTVTNFTVLINNVDPKLLLGPLAFIAIQESFQCSVTVSQDQVSQPVGTGYTLLFANPFNNTDVYATSEQFEIKPLGSLYPTQVTSSSSLASGTGSAAAASGTAASTTGGALSAQSPSFMGLAGVLGLLAVGLLGA
ncbi:hypothetical protein BYT27DRAFT_7263881 [Phlegmacium glaucopus]|nr:hypothetical protein BYT27DRAFT_7263881 [Phlegmacium glaucopus]